jgi:hypothetical protein
MITFLIALAIYAILAVVLIVKFKQGFSMPIFYKTYLVRKVTAFRARHMAWYQYRY